MSPPQHPLQPTLLPFFAPAVFESGIAATSSPVIARQLVSPSNNNGHIITNCTNGTNQTPQNPNLYGTPAPQVIIEKLRRFRASCFRFVSNILFLLLAYYLFGCRS